MPRDKKKADIAAKEYFRTKRKIEELRAKREELWEKFKTGGNAFDIAETNKLSAQIEVAHQELNYYAKLVVENLYEEDQDEQ